MLLAYGGDGKLDSVTDPAGRVTAFEHDGAGNVTKITDPDGAERAFVYDALNQMIEQITPLGDTERMTYDAFGRNTSIERTDGGLFQIAAAETQGLVDPASGQGTAANPAPLAKLYNFPVDFDKIDSDVMEGDAPWVVVVLDDIWVVVA